MNGINATYSDPLPRALTTNGLGSDEDVGIKSL